MEEYQQKLAQLKADFLGNSIPGDLFYEAMRQIGGDDGESCWQKSFDLTEQYIKTLEEYIKALEEQLKTQEKTK